MRSHSSERPIGGSYIRVDSRQKVTGQARYAEDMVMPGLLHARTLRSPHPHARLVALDTTKAAQLPGVARIITAADIPGVNGFPEYSRGEPVLTPVGDTVRMVGAPVAFVVAETPDIACKALKLVEAVYEVLPHTYDPREALDPSAFPIYPDGNVLTTYRLEHGDLEAALGRSEVMIEATYRSAYQEHSALERETALGYIDEEGRVAVVCATHEPHWQQAWIAATLALPVEQVRVIVPPTGGSFGGKQDPWPLIAAGLLAYVMRCPVRLVFSRRESFDASPKRHPYEVSYRIGATRDGYLTGAQVRIDANTGGYDSAGYWIPGYATAVSGGAYRWQAIHVFAQTIFTNGPKSGQFRGFGTPQANYALECALDELIEKLGEDPIEFRLKNRILQGEKTFLGYPVAETFDYGAVLEAVRPRYRQYSEEAAAFNAAQPPDSPYRKGVGLAGMWYRFGKSGSLRVEVHAELASDGHFVVYCAAPDYGQGTNTSMTQIAAETLGVPLSQVELINSDTGRVPDSGIQGASRATYWVGSAVQQAVSTLKLGILGTAAEMIGCDPSELSFDGGAVVCRHDPAGAVPLAEVALEFDRLGKPRKIPGFFDLTPLFPDESRPEYTPQFTTGAHVAEVIVDMETGLVEVTRMAAAHDVGRAINPVDAKGQIEGAVVMGLGSALLEEYQPGKTTGFTDYILPMIHAMPREIEVILVEVPSLYGPFGAKGIGEVAMLPSTPAIVNAVSRAIGVRIRQIPATPERVLAAIRQR